MQVAIGVGGVSASAACATRRSSERRKLSVRAQANVGGRAPEPREGSAPQRNADRIATRVATFRECESLPLLQGTSPTILRGTEFEVDLARFGQQTIYGNGQARPMMRGWVHLIALAVLELILAAGLVKGPAASLVRWSTVGMYGSVTFHMVPWATLPAYQLALFLDFLCISTCLTGQVAVWAGFKSPLFLMSLALTACKVALSVRGLMQKKVLLSDYRRSIRLNLVFLQFAFTSIVEALVIPNKPLVGLIVFGKAVGLLLYFLHGRHDAPFKPTVATVPGWWGDHDNFHLMMLFTLVAQLAAAMAL